MDALCWPELAAGLLIGGGGAVLAWIVAEAIGFNAGITAGRDFEHRMGEANFRLGHEIEAFGGVRQDCDPGAIPINMFRNLINGRFSGGGIKERGGQHKLNETPLEGCVTGIIPGDGTPTDFEETLYILSSAGEFNSWTPPSGLGTPTAPADWVNLQSTPGNDPEGAEESITLSDNSTAGLDLHWSTLITGNDPPYAFGSAGTSSYGCSGGIAKHVGLWYRAIVRAIAGIDTYQVLVSPLDTIERQFVGGSGSDSTTRVWLAIYEETGEMLAALEPSALHRRSSAGVWSRVPLPAACTINRNHLANFAEYEGLFYFTGYGPGGGHLLYEYDGSSITAVHSWAGTPGTYSPLVVRDGALYYAVNAGGVIRLGRYDGTTFIDALATFSGTAEVRQLVVAFGRLMALRGDTLESSLAPASAPFVVDDSTAGAFQAGGVQRLR